MTWLWVKRWPRVTNVKGVIEDRISECGLTLVCDGERVVTSWEVIQSRTSKGGIKEGRIHC